jgi:hypothetical protein
MSTYIFFTALNPALHLTVRRVALAAVWMGVAVTACWAASEPQRIYRCGNVYTNQPEPGRTCTPLASTQVTVIEGTRVQGPQVGQATGGASGGTGGAGAGAVHVDSTQQRQRDAQAQVLLQAELQRAQQQHAVLLREWRNGEPERRADELHQPVKYQARVAQMRAALERVQADIAGLQRELSRAAVSASSVGKP